MGDAHFSETKGNVFRKRKTKWPGSYRCARQMGSRWSPSSRRSQWWPWCQRWPSWILKSWGQPSHWGCGVSWIPARKGIGGQGAGVQLFQGAWQPHSLRAICTFHAPFQKTTADIKRKWRDSGNEITKRIYSIFLINAQPVVRIFRGLVSKVASVFPRPRCSRWLDQSGLRSTLGFAGEKKLCLRISVRISFFIRFIWSKSTVENYLGPKTFYLIFGHLVNHQPVLCPWHCEVHRNLKKEWFCMILTLWCTTITNALVYIWPPTRPPWVKAWYISLAKNTSQPITPLWSYCKKHVALYWPQVKTVPGGGRFLPEAIVLSISLPNKIERKRSENL